MSTYALDKVCSPLYEEYRAKIVQVLNTKFKTKERANIIMEEDSNDYQRIVKKPKDTIAKAIEEIKKTLSSLMEKTNTKTISKGSTLGVNCSVVDLENKIDE